MHQIISLITLSIIALLMLVLYLFLGKEKYKRYVHPALSPIIAFIAAYNIGRSSFGDLYNERITLLYIFPFMIGVFAFLVAWYRRERR